MTAQYCHGYPVVFVAPPMTTAGRRWFVCPRDGYGESDRLPPDDLKGNRYCPMCGRMLAEIETPSFAL